MFRYWYLAVCAALFAVAWGCSKQPPSASSTGKADPALEARVTRLETELKQVQASRDALKTELSALQTKWQNEVVHGQALTKERDSLRAELKTRTTEKESLQVQFDGFRKNLKELLGQAEAAALPPPVVPAPNATSSAISLPAPRPGF